MRSSELVSSPQSAIRNPQSAIRNRSPQSADLPLALLLRALARRRQRPQVRLHAFELRP